MITARQLNEHGSALPITIFIVTVLTIMVTASFTQTRNELQLAGGSTDVVSAFTVAQSGVESYIGMDHLVRPPDGDSMRVNVAGGYADVVAHVMRNDTLNGNWTYVIRSTGHVIDAPAGPEPQGVHTVARFAHWQWGEPSKAAAWSSIAAFLVSSSLPPGVVPDTYVSGVDACGQEPTIPGVRARSIPDTTGVTTVGNPPTIEHGSSAPVSLLTGIDWAAALTSGIEPDSDSLIPSDTTFKTYRIAGNLTAPTFRGTGLLIVNGYLHTVGSHFVWDGVVLVGSRLLANANDSTVVRGMLVTGLNWQTGAPYDDMIVEGDPIDVRYDSCHIKRALSSVRGFVSLRNGWLDHWSTY